MKFGVIWRGCIWSLALYVEAVYEGLTIGYIPLPVHAMTAARARHVLHEMIHLSIDFLAT